ncbi:SecA DEAD domain protein [Pirellula staleyi DSM 6068]|uniref:Protein translocase subunit SecA n=1 Tax=Pirellula staleyi (strain ATCC 27377 / DSM 6068 / ICPB 4128) TaxID=530564 RepID=D2R6G7_PIRSD|nr:preprotein translocase subunit SecA [Pirellula staleyi]ADB15545.1 SecA DEAD domain protein [Pirellula staleyi DSM 6068]
MTYASLPVSDIGTLPPLRNIMTNPPTIHGLPTGWRAQVLSLLGGPVQSRLARWGQVLPQIAAFEETLVAEDDRELRKRSLSLKYRAKSGEKLATLLPEAYALVREASRRVIGQRHYDVQMIGGIALFHGSIAEMETGEGKTLTATLPMYLHALVGKGSHLATVNDYLAERDANMMRPVYAMLGLTTGVVLTKDKSDARRKAYGCDITYGTAKEFGFDFLRDRLLLRRLGAAQGSLLGQFTGVGADANSEQPVQREAHFCLVDEADSILIDEARTPLIIGALGDKAIDRIVATYRWAAEVQSQFLEEKHYDYDDEDKKVELTAAGRQLLRALPKPELLSTMGLVDLYQYIERAIKVARDYLLNRHYVVIDGEITIVDENTGRLAEGRKWRDGIHQAIEAKEKIEVSVATGQAARITVQDLFLRYKHIAGMTGTAMSATNEFRKVYKMRVVPIPTNRPSQRKRLPDLVFGTEDEKWAAVVEDVKAMNQVGRPVLIGTKSIDKSMHLSRLLTAAGITHRVLNANEVEREAEIVALAGEQFKVTVATNMAGRGTDIKLAPGMRELGGLHVICTELHDSARIDRQLVGRCGRQGDPGTTRQYMSLDDDVIKSGYGPEVAERMEQWGKTAGPAAQRQVGMIFRAQQRVERKHLRDRFALLHHEKERKKMQLEMGQDPYLDTPD